MSVRSELKQEGDTFKYAFLAAQTTAILKQSESKSLSSDEQETLKNAEKFVESLISGTENLREGRIHAFASYDAMKALSVVLSPVDSLRSFVNQEKGGGIDETRLLNIFNRIERYLTTAVKDCALPENPDKKLACHFFEWLAGTLIETVSQLRSANLNYRHVKRHVFNANAI